MPLISGTPQHQVASNKTLYDWTARLTFDKYELGSSFGVLLFLGEVPNNPQQWEISPNLVGASHAYVDRRPHPRNPPSGIQEGFVHLNRGILEHSGLSSFEIDVVVPYLTRALEWRVITSDGTPADLRSLEVVVFVTPLSLPPGSNFPVPGEPRRLDRITYGRHGGSRHAPA